MIAPFEPTVKCLRYGLLTAAALLCFSFSTPAQAAHLGEDLGAARADLAALQDGLQLAQAERYQGDRIAALEGVVRELTGRVETLEYRLRQLGERVERLENATEAPVAQTAEPSGAYYQPPPETRSDEAPAGQRPAAQGGPRVLGTPQETYSAASTSSETPSSEAGAFGGTGPDISEEAQRPEAAQTAALPSGDAASQYDHAFGLLRQARWEDAEAALEAFLQAHGNHALAGNAKYWLGETHYVRGDYVSAARVFAEGFQEYPESSKAPDNLLKLGMSLGSLDRRDDACGTLNELERRYGDAPSQILQRSRAEREKLGC